MITTHHLAPMTSGRIVDGRTCHDLVNLVGNTPVLWIPELGGGDGGFWAKLEGHNPGGIKDRPGLYMVARAQERGLLAPGAPIVESTSGTLGVGLALAGVAYGHPVTVVTDPGLEPIMRSLLQAYGAQVDRRLAGSSAAPSAGTRAPAAGCLVPRPVQQSRQRRGLRDAGP